MSVAMVAIAPECGAPGLTELPARALLLPALQALSVAVITDPVLVSQSALK